MVLRKFLINMISRKFLLSTIVLSMIFLVPVAYAAQPVIDREKIDSTSNNIGEIAGGDKFGLEIENIGDLDGDGINDLAVIEFNDSTVDNNLGSVLILFMNDDGSVKDTNEIDMSIDDSGIGESCIAGDGTNRRANSLEQLAFVGDLDLTDGKYKPTLALGAAANRHNGLGNSGAVYMLELDTDGTVANCFAIIPSIPSSTTGFNPDSDKYLETGGAFLGLPLIATDLDGDTINELLVGAGNNDDDSTNMWVLFLNSTGGVDHHPDTPIFGITDLKSSSGNYIEAGDTISGGKKIVLGAYTEGTSGTIFIVNLDSTGGFESSTTIAGTSLDPGVAAGSHFGSGVTGIGDMDGDGIDDIMVGAIRGDDSNNDSGEVYILFMNSDDEVKESQKISNESEFARIGEEPFAASDEFGNGMALWQTSDNVATIAISAHKDDTGGNNSGAMYLFYVEFVPPSKNGTGGGTLPQWWLDLRSL